MAIIESILVGTAVNAGTSLLSSLFSEKPKTQKTKPSDVAARKEMELSASYQRAQSAGIPGRPPTAIRNAFDKSEGLYAGYRLPAVVDALLDRIDAEKGSQVGEFGVIRDSDISTRRS